MLNYTIKNKSQKRNGSLLVNLAIYGIFAMILLCGVASIGSATRGVQDDVLKNQASVVDRALYIWYASHSGKFPAQLSTLQTMGYISDQVPLSSFTYTLRNSQTQYSLTVNLSSGAYKTPGSSY